MNVTNSMIQKLVELSTKAFNDGEVPVSALVVDKNGNVISSCYNKRQDEANVLNHAEIMAIVDASKKMGDWRLNGYNLICTLEPCEMCSVIIREARIDGVYYMLSRNNKNDFYWGNIISKEEILGYDFEKKQLELLLENFFENKRR